MNRFFTIMGWALIAGGILGGLGSFFFVQSQEFVLALLARVVERPFEYRTYAAVLTGAVVVVQAGLLGTIYLGIGRILERSG